ncbi:MAG: hypothetical protein Kow0098_18910 [Ignavibacteriaceae bacterium]
MKSDAKIDFRLFDNFEDICFLLADNGTILKTNKTGKEKLSLSENEVIGREIASVIITLQKSNIQSMFEKAKKNGNYRDKNALIDINGKQFNIELLLTPYYNLNGRESARLYFALCRDITEQKKKEIELLRFFRVAENTVNPLQITDIDGRMIYVNPAFVAASGYSKEELIGKNPRIFGSGKNSKKFWEKMWSTIKSGKVWVGEVENRRKNGEPFFTQLLISPILDDKGEVTGFFGIHRDLSEKRVLERQLIHTQKMESIGTLAAGIAHEVGNPLASISALVQVAQRSTDDQFITEKLGLVKSQVTRISKIIRDLVDFSRPSNYELQLTDINQSINEAVEITRVGTKAKNIRFDVSLNEKIPKLPLIADQIQQVFVNIMLNAVDAINEKNEFDKPQYISVSSDLTDDDVIIVFTDSGKGIPEEHLNKIFEPFFTTKKEGKGTGLGLWVSYGIVKSFQGDIKVKSKPGEGTVFTIKLPIQS